MKKDTNFFDATYDEAKGSFCYRSGMMVYEECLIGGVLVASGYNTAGYPLNVLSNYPTRLDPNLCYEPSAFHLEIDGQCLHYDLSFVDFSVDKSEQSVHAVLTLVSNVKPITVKAHTILDGSAVFTRFLEIENCSDEIMRVSRMEILSGGLEKMVCFTEKTRTSYEDEYSIGYFDSDEWGREGDFSWRALPFGKTTVDCRFERNRYRHPIIFIRNNLLGKTYISQIGWSGGCRFTVDRAPIVDRKGNDRKDSFVSFKAVLTGYSPLVVLRGGETFTTPEVYMGVVAGDLDEAINEMHTHTRRSVLCADEINSGACLIGAGMGAEHDMSVETSKAFIDQMCEMGAEVFIIDAGWECPPAHPIDWKGYNGINLPNPDRYPNGIGEISDYCHAKGMKFGLWVEIERLGVFSAAYAEHPEWRSRDIFGKQSENFIDLTNSEAFAWAKSELERIVVEYKLDLLRVDYNVLAKDYFAMRDMGSGIKECISFRHIQAVYKLYGELKKKFPNVIFENCASGGARTDLGMMRCFDHTWVSDWQRAPRSVMITNGMTMALPPERVDRLVSGMNCHEYASFDLHVRNALLGHVSLNVIAPTMLFPNPIQMEFLQHSMEIYKSFIRPILPTAKVFHHTPNAASDGDGTLSILEIASPDGASGALTVCTLMNAEADLFIRPRGIDIERTYEVTFDNTGSTVIVSGYELFSHGVRISIPSALSSELILYRAI